MPKSAREPLPPIRLSQEERTFLRHLLVEHIDYYRTLAGHSAASEATKTKLRFLEVLYEKLST